MSLGRKPKGHSLNDNKSRRRFGGGRKDLWAASAGILAILSLVAVPPVAQGSDGPEPSSVSSSDEGAAGETTPTEVTTNQLAPTEQASEPAPTEAPKDTQPTDSKPPAPQERSAKAATGVTNDTRVALTAKTGTPEFDSAGQNGGGLDDGEDNYVIRTNDTTTYIVEVSPTKQIDKPVITLTAPKGQEFRDVPSWCKRVAGKSAVSSPQPAMVQPKVPLSAESWKSLPTQTLSCALDDPIKVNSTQSYKIPTFQRIEVPNGTVLEPAKVSVYDAKELAGEDTMEQGFTVSAGPRWDVSKNNINVDEDRGFVNSREQPCAFDPSQGCFTRTYSLLISTDNGGKGAAPLKGDVTFVDKLNPRSFYGDNVINSAAWKAAGDEAVEMYAPRLRDINTIRLQYKQFFPRLTDQGATVQNAVRNSGNAKFTHTAGQDATITISNADWSLYTYPSETQTHREKVPDSRAYAVSFQVLVDVPASAVRDLGKSKRLLYKNTYTDFRATALDGTKQVGEPEDLLWNNYRRASSRVTVPGSLAKYFVGVPGDDRNTPASIYSSGDQIFEGPPGSVRKGDGLSAVGPGQVIISSVIPGGSTIINSTEITRLVCDSWDNSKLQLQAGNYPVARPAAYNNGSNGAAVWRGGALNEPADWKPIYKFQYSGGQDISNHGSKCTSGQWFDDPADVPGNDPAKASKGTYTAVNAVRIYTVNPRPKDGARTLTREYFNIALRVVDNQKNSTVLPNWVNERFYHGTDWRPTIDELVADDPRIRERLSTYSENDYDNAPSGKLGDRVIYTPAYTRIDVHVKRQTDKKWRKSLNAAPKEKLTWRIQPKLSSAGAAETPQPVTVEYCLPHGFTYEGASIPPEKTMVNRVPEGSEVKCDSGTYFRWVFDDVVPNAEIPSIDLNVEVSSNVEDGTHTGQATVQTDPADPSPLDRRRAQAQVSVQSPSGIIIDKYALTPTIQVNRADTAEAKGKLEDAVWEFEFRNHGARGSLTNVDLIDALPVKSGVNDSKFSGTMTFHSAKVTAGDNVQTLYTKVPVDQISLDPLAESNGDSGIAWCDAIGGKVVKGKGECPAKASDVTGLRFLRPGSFANGKFIRAQIAMTGAGNHALDVYDNKVAGRAKGLNFTVGPDGAPVQVVGGSIGDRVWNDSNHNGLQDEGETPVKGFPVKLTGTDDLGNKVGELTTQTNESGTYSFPDLREGTYTVQFDPEALPENSKFTLQGQGSNRLKDSDGDQDTGLVQNISLRSAAARTDIDQGIFSPGTVTWSKQDENGKLLTDSKWEIRGSGTSGITLPVTDCKGNPCNGQDKNPEPGQFKVTGLYWGTYQLVETAAPAGFVLDTSPHQFVINGSEDAAGLQVDAGAITNRKHAVPVLPLTGGVGAALFLLVGGAVIASGAVIGLRAWNKRRA